MKKLYILGTLFLCALTANAQFNVTLQVDMQNETVDPALGVHAAGSFQAAAGFPSDWDPASTELTDPDGDGVYDITMSVPAGTYDYKFVNGNAWGSDESVPSACATSNNRTLMVSADMTTPLVCFGSCVTCPGGPIPVYSLTFEVDMATTCDVDSVDIAGTLNNWSGGDMLRDPDGDDVYSITLDVDSGEVMYKFRRYFAGNANWEGISDRIYQATGDATIPFTCFNDIAACSPVPATADVTFRVDMTNEAPDASGVFIIGDFTSPAWQDGAIQLNADPTNPGFYQTTYSMCPGTFFWKFVNGDPDPNSSVVEIEEGFPNGDTLCNQSNGIGGFNRVTTRTNDQPLLLAYVFNTCTESIGIEENFALQSIQVYPNPVNDISKVDLGIEDQYNVSILDLSGREVKQMRQVNGAVAINGSELKAGVYILSVTNSNGERNQSRFIVR